MPLEQNARASAAPDTIVHRLFEQARAQPEAPALVRLLRGARDPIPWRRYAELVSEGARALLAEELPKGGVVAILSANRREWLLADLAAIAAGGVPTGIYPTSTAEQTAYILRHSGAHVAVVENAEQLAKLRTARADLPNLRRVVLFDGEPQDGDGWAISWAQFLAGAGRVTPEALATRIAELRPDDLATLIYTSGTTGEPKGVMLSHRNLTFTADATRAVLPGDFAPVVLSYLPLSHIAEQMISLHLAVSLGGTVFFGSGPETLRDDLQQTQPTFFFGVPRVWEKLEAALTERFRSVTGLKRALLSFARGAALAEAKAAAAGRRLGPVGALRLAVARRLVLHKLHAALGLGRTRIFVSGAAPISSSTLRFFATLDVRIREVYGLSETCGPSTFNGMEEFRPGTVGRAIPGVRARLAGDGEVLLAGNSVFLGYYRNAAATAECLDNGWFKTGDIGTLDADGFLSITDRKKDLLITAGGKNVAPQPLEQRLAAIPEVAQAVVLGDRERYLAALLALQSDACLAWARAQGVRWSGLDELAADSRFRTYIEHRIERINAGLATYETIKRFELLPRELSQELGELTPTLKIKRRVIAERHKAVIARLFAIAG